MIIKTTFESADKAMATVASTINDKMLQEDMKNVIIWVKEGNVRFVANNGNIVTAINVDGTADYEGEEETEYFAQLRAKDITDVFATLRGLKRTKVSEVAFHIKENEAVLHITEIPIDEDMQFADAYNQTTKFRITKTRLKEIIKNEILKINPQIDGVEMNREDLLVFVNALLPTVASETREGTSNIMFGNEHIYTILPAYAAIMPNKLDPVFSGFRLPNSVVNFLKNFVTPDETFIFHKQEMGNGLVILTLKNSNAIAVIKCADMSRAFDITNFVPIPHNGIVLDRMYLLDVLKRISLNKEAVFVEVVIENGIGSMKVVSKSMTQSIPVIKAKGEGVFSFSIRADLLSSVVFSHANYFDDNIFLYFEHGDRNNIIMACRDNTELWHTKLMGLSSAKGDFAWG